MKTRLLLVAATLFTAFNVSAQTFTSYSVSVRDTLVVGHGIAESTIQLRFFGSATLTEEAAPRQMMTDSKGNVVEVQQPKRDQKIFPSKEKGLKGVGVVEMKYDTVQHYETGKKQWVTDRIDSTRVLYVEFDDFPGYRLPFISNGGTGSNAKDNSYVLATTKFKKLAIDGKVYNLVGSGSLKYYKGKAKSQKIAKQTARGKKVQN